MFYSDLKFVLSVIDAINCLEQVDIAERLVKNFAKKHELYYYHTKWDAVIKNPWNVEYDYLVTALLDTIYVIRDNLHID